MSHYLSVQPAELRCPLCHSPEGEPCRSHKGNPRREFHQERIAEAIEERERLNFGLSPDPVWRWPAVLGGGEHCPDGEWHCPSFSQSGGLLRCRRCGTHLQVAAEEGWA